LPDPNLPSASINVHLYTSATLKFALPNNQEISLSQTTNYPWTDDVHFNLASPPNTPITINLRIPHWASDSFSLIPALPTNTSDPKNGYLTLPPSYLHAYPSFRLSLPMTPRLIRPHPFTNQHTVAVARGPLVYCVEDIDNTWATNHFKEVIFDTAIPLEEAGKSDLPEKEEYVAIVAKGAARVMGERWDGRGRGPEFEIGRRKEEKREDLRFMPYYARANRGGGGMMRVVLSVEG
jgi:DUF1680 family protein